MIARLRAPIVALSLALLLFSSRSSAQETFGASSEEEPAAAPASPAPAAAPAADEWWRAKPLPPHLKPPGKPVAIRLDGAYAPRRLFGLGITGADLGLAIGAQTSQHTAWWGTSRLTLGSTENGLSVWSFRLGAELEAVYSPVRFGIGASMFGLGIDRAHRDQTLLTYGVEARAFVRVDCMRNDDFALFLRGGIDGAVEAKSGAAFWGPALGVGVELGVSGKKPAAWSTASPTQLSGRL